VKEISKAYFEGKDFEIQGVLRTFEASESAVSIQADPRSMKTAAIESKKIRLAALPA